MTLMVADTSGTGSHLFTLRLWVEELVEGQFEWRGQVTYVPTGETHYLRRWGQLQETLQLCLPGLEFARDGRGDC